MCTCMCITVFGAKFDVDVIYVYLFFLMFIYSQLEEELFKASYVLSEGDAAAFLPSKSHGMLRVFPFVKFKILLVVCWF